MNKTKTDTSYEDAYKPKKLPNITRKDKVETRYEPKEIPFDPNTYSKVGFFTPNKTSGGVYRSWKDMNTPVENKDVIPERKQGKLEVVKPTTLPLETGVTSGATSGIYTTFDNHIEGVVCPVKRVIKLERNKMENN